MYQVSLTPDFLRKLHGSQTLYNLYCIHLNAAKYTILEILNVKLEFYLIFFFSFSGISENTSQINEEIELLGNIKASIGEIIEELADILEVVYAAAAAHGVTRDTLENIRAEKRRKNGGFSKKLFLKEVHEQQ